MDAGCLRARSLLLFLGECRRRAPPVGAVPSRSAPREAPLRPRAGAGGAGRGPGAESRGWGLLWLLENLRQKVSLPSGDTDVFLLRDEVVGRGECT